MRIGFFIWFDCRIYVFDQKWEYVSQGALNDKKKKKKAQKFYKNVPGHKSERSLDDHVADFLETIMEMFFLLRV